MKKSVPSSLKSSASAKKQRLSSSSSSSVKKSVSARLFFEISDSGGDSSGMLVR